MALGLSETDIGVRPLDFTIEGDLPPGFSFDPENANAETALLDGTPEATGTFDFDYVVTDANGEEVFREEFRVRRYYGSPAPPIDPATGTRRRDCRPTPARAL